jgi:hypothetical protein
MPPRVFTLAAANALIPRLEPLVRRLRETGQELRRHQGVIAEFRARASRDGGVMPGSQFAQAKTETERLAGEIHEGVRQIESWGCVLKDLDLGLVDFPARRRGQQVFLCWRLGEAEIRYWHRVEDGFAGRKPLEEDPVD